MVPAGLSGVNLGASLFIVRALSIEPAVSVFSSLAAKISKVFVLNSSEISTVKHVGVRESINVGESFVFSFCDSVIENSGGQSGFAESVCFISLGVVNVEESQETFGLVSVDATSEDVCQVSVVLNVSVLEVCAVVLIVPEVPARSPQRKSKFVSKQLELLKIPVIERPVIHGLGGENVKLAVELISVVLHHVEG